METTLSKRLTSMAESETLAMMRISRELASKGYDIISLALGEPDFNTPDNIKEAAIEAINNNFTHYTPVAGIPDLKQAICTKLKRDNNLDYTPEQIVVSTGAKQSIFNAMMCLVDPGDEVIVPSPYWVSYKEIIKLAEGSPVYLDASIEQDFKITPSQLEAAITPKTKVIIYSSPCNPSGSVYTYQELKNLALIIKNHPGLYVITDEVYEHINFSGEHHTIAEFDFIKDQVILVNGVSKGFAMTGWRLGYIAANIQIARACDKLQGQVTSATCSITQKAAVAALNTDPKTSPDIQNMLKAFRNRRDTALEMLKKIPGVKTNTPAGAFYILPDISYYFGKKSGNYVINDDNDLCDYLLKEHHVAVVPGTAFGSPGTFRLSYATSMERLTEAINRISKGLLELK